MSLKIKSPIAILFIFNFTCVTIYGGDLIPINEKNKHWYSVKSEINQLTKIDPNSLIVNRVHEFGEITTKDANSLFPDWKFYGLKFYTYPKDPCATKKISIPGGFDTTLAVSNSNPRKTFRLYNYEDYAKFLKMNKIVIKDANEAKLVWDSWCEIHRSGGKELKIEKIDVNVWKLGIKISERKISPDNVVKTTSFYKVSTDPNTKQIIDWKLIMETSDKGKEKIP